MEIVSKKYISKKTKQFLDACGITYILAYASGTKYDEFAYVKLLNTIIHNVKKLKRINFKDIIKNFISSLWTIMRAFPCPRDVDCQAIVINNKMTYFCKNKATTCINTKRLPRALFNIAGMLLPCIGFSVTGTNIKNIILPPEIECCNYCTIHMKKFIKNTTLLFIYSLIVDIYFTTISVLEGKVYKSNPFLASGYTFDNYMREYDLAQKTKDYTNVRKMINKSIGSQIKNNIDIIIKKNK